MYFPSFYFGTIEIIMIFFLCDNKNGLGFFLCLIESHCSICNSLTLALSFHFLFAVENSPESNYVPGSFSAKGRKIRSSSNAAPANLDKAINQVRSK